MEKDNPTSGNAAGHASETVKMDDHLATEAIVDHGATEPDATLKMSDPRTVETESVAEAEQPQASDLGTKPKFKKDAKKQRGKTPKRKDKKSRGPSSAHADTDRDRGSSESADAATSSSVGGAEVGAQMAVYLTGCSLAAAPAVPRGTFPEQLEALCPEMISASALLTTAAAVLGPNPAICAPAGRVVRSLSLRIGLLLLERTLSSSVMPALEAAYALERQDAVGWNEERRQLDLLNSGKIARHRLRRQTLANAALLGLDVTNVLQPDTDSASPGRPRPQFVLRDPVPKNFVKTLSEATQGLLVVDGRRMPSMSGFGVNYDTEVAKMLNKAAAGDHLELADPQATGCVQPRQAHVSVIGVLSTVDSFGLHKAGPEALAATVLIPAEAEISPVAGAVEALTDVLRRVRALGIAIVADGTPLRFSAPAKKALLQIEARLSSSEVLPPLAGYYCAVPDLARRIAIVLHFLDHASRKAETVPVEVGRETAVRAVAFVEHAVLPAARNVLAASSVTPEVRDGRRLLSYAQWRCGPASPEFTRRDVTRILPNSMTPRAFDKAVARLRKDGLLAPEDPGTGGRTYKVNPIVFEEQHALPDLISDPRRVNL